MEIKVQGNTPQQKSHCDEIVKKYARNCELFDCFFFAFYVAVDVSNVCEIIKILNNRYMGLRIKISKKDLNTGAEIN